MIDGIFHEWWRGTNIKKSEITYKNNYRDGIAIEYNESGSKIKEYYNWNNKKNGKYIEWDKDGNKVCEYNFKNDVKVEIIFERKILKKI
jgi:antitoxin component YwqK of YwqJK toxin-antitoxin module